MTRKELRGRWKRAEFIDKNKALIALLESHKIGFSLDSGPTIEHEDMAGIELTGSTYSLYKSKISECDLRFSTISRNLDDSSIERVNFGEAKFDRNAMINTLFLQCDFSKSKIISNYTDAKFNKCTFSGALFSGGSCWARFGGTRVQFTECNFVDTIFKSTTLRASRFINCSFHKTKFISTDLRGVKLESCIGVETIQIERMEIPSGGIEALPYWAKNLMNE